MWRIAWPTCGGVVRGGLGLRSRWGGGGVGVGKIWVALVVLAAELLVLTWLVGVRLWDWTGSVVAE